MLRRMNRSFPAALALAAAALFPLPGRASETPLDEAYRAWQRGDYISALTTYLRLLDSPGAEQVLEPIALQTGELYHTIELTADGLVPQFSPDGRYIAYETGTALKKVTRILRADGNRDVIAELPGSGAAFSPDSSTLAYLKLGQPSEELVKAQAAVDAAANLPANERQERQAALTRLFAAEWRIAIHDLASGRETIADTGTLGKTAVRLGAGGALLFSGPVVEGTSQIYLIKAGAAAAAATTGDGDKVLGAINSPGTAALYTVRARGGGRGAGRGGGGRGGAAETQPDTTAAGERGGEGTSTEGGGRGTDATTRPRGFGVIAIADGTVKTSPGSAPAFSADGKTLAFIGRDGDDYRLMAGGTFDPAAASVVRRGPERLDAPAPSQDGSQFAFQLMAREDWEIYVVNRDGAGERRLSREIQHDIVPQLLPGGRIVAAIGEARHRRSYLYDVASGGRTRLFHNNTIRTIAPEYAWVADHTGNRLLISAERDGNTVSTPRGIYLVDLSRKVTVPELRQRVVANLEAEKTLVAKARTMYAPIADAVRKVVARASVDRVFSYEEKLFSFDSKHITRPGNKLASQYLFDTYKSFGYQPEFQWFAGRNALGGQTANVIATLKGTVNPELVYVVSSHYDSVAVGPGADDDSSGTAALLETARIMADQPQAATIVFASFTGEEAGLLGSREYVKRAVAGKLRIIGALNNDMVGWANDQRLDNTIRYSNVGIRDVQHAAAMQFTNMITYDALYYKSTDAAAYYEAYGDIVGGIGSYPVLGNPHYHQSHDVLETINHQLVTEVAKTTAATLMLLASSPSRLTGLTAERAADGTVSLSWSPSPESGVTGYIVSYGPEDQPQAQQVRVTKAAATLKNIAPGTIVSVKAVNAKGLEGWDWARVRIESK
jgi:hypothetical protein